MWIFPPVYEKIRERKERNEVEENKKGSWKVRLLLWNSLFFYIRLRCVFSFCMVSEKMREKVMGLYVHFLLSINIRVFLKFISLFLFDSKLWKHIGLPKKISSWIKKKNCLYLDFLAILFWCFALLVKILKHDIMENALFL